MDPITISLVDPEMKAYVDQVVSSGAFGSVNEYVEALISEDRKRRAQARLEALLLEGLEGEPAPLTDQDWDEMRRRYDARHSEVIGP